MGVCVEFFALFRVRWKIDREEDGSNQPRSVQCVGGEAASGVLHLPEGCLASHWVGLKFVETQRLYSDSAISKQAPR